VRLRTKSTSSGDTGAALRALESLQDEETRSHAETYLHRLALVDEPLWMTTERAAFERAIGRRVGGGIGGAYVFHHRRRLHLVFINLARIDRAQPRAVEIVVAEELIHMRDWINGDRRRHAKHGYDRIAHRLADLTGASLDEIRSCLLPRKPRPVRYLYRCPGCERVVQRRVKGTWSCARCSPRFDRRFVLVLENDLRRNPTAEESVDLSRPTAKPG
jgi:predicted SprT family Zn-dependent metalloprotease